MNLLAPVSVQNKIRIKLFVPITYFHCIRKAEFKSLEKSVLTNKDVFVPPCQQEHGQKYQV